MYINNDARKTMRLYLKIEHLREHFRLFLLYTLSPEDGHLWGLKAFASVEFETAQSGLLQIGTVKL